MKMTIKLNVGGEQFENPFSVVLFDGLGNRLFQLAFAYNYAKKYNQYFFLSFIYENPHSKNVFKNKLLEQTKMVGISEQHCRAIMIPDQFLFKYVEIPSLKQDFVPVFRGFFQSEKYFKETKDEIVDLLKPIIENENELIQKYDKLKDSYFIHVRRGDYLKSRVHSVNLENYFKKCIEMLGEEEHYYICSDDIEWCKTFFTNPHKTFVEENEINTLWLMSQCFKGGICSNSTFSWWGSYFNTNSNKKVCFPEKWLTHETIDYYGDIYPSYATIVDV